MFGITDVHAEGGTRGEQEDSLGSTGDMSPTREKRPASPGSVHPSVKQLKYDQKFSYPEGGCDDNGLSTERLSSSNALLKQDAERQAKNRSKLRETSDRPGSREASVESTRLNKLNGSDRTNANDRSDSNIDKLQAKYKLENVKLKELRIVLKDIKHDGKSAKNSSAESNLWEVEKILGKKVNGNTLTYLVKWKDWGPEYNTWEPTSNLVNCSDILENFEAERSQLLDRFKRKVNFYPTDQDVEEYWSQLRYKGETLASISVEQNAVFATIRNFFKQKLVRNRKLEKFSKFGILRMLLCDARRKQLQSLEQWEIGMNNVTKGKPLIRVENIVDLEKAPQDFYYIDEYLPGAGVIIPDDPPIGCECRTCDSKADCCFTQYAGYCPYTSTCKVRVPPGTPIYECNKRCTCDINCMNRVVQRGTQMKLCIFRTANGRGWGVKTLRAIRKGTFVTQYVGEVITSEEAEKRGKEYDAAGRTYLFDLDYNETEEQCPYTVDAAMYGNISHFINHSCDPNLAVYGVWINCLDPNLPKLALFATRDIKQNAEITFDYTCQSSRNSENSIKQDVSMMAARDLGITTESQEAFEIRPETPESDTSTNKTLCKCGARSCRRYLF